jgi:hypothetical protein
MISDFERSLATLLGARLPSPFNGSVVVAPAPQNPAAETIVVGVTSAVPATAAFGSQLPQQTPAVAGTHRVLRLDCTVTMTVVPQGDRALQANGAQQLLWVLDDPEVKAGRALSDGTDQGFVLDQFGITSMTVPLDPEATPVLPPGPAGSPPGATVAVTALASGWFWPVGTTGAVGIAIGHVLVRGISLPVLVSPTAPRSAPGGDPISISVRVDASTMDVSTPTGAAGSLPFTALIATLAGEKGAAATGSLTGGTSGTNTLRTYPVSEGSATVTYTPAAVAGNDVLSIALDDGSGGAGVILGSVPIQVR